MSVSNTVSTAVQVISTAALPLYVTGLSNGTLYKFAVSATNFFGASAYSATVSATPVLRTYTSPLVTNGLVLRMDAAQIWGVAQSNVVSTWTDTSGAANHAVRQGGSSAGYPMYVTNVLNGQSVVRFNSGNANTGDYFQFPRITTIRTVFWVLKENAGLSDGHFLLGDDSSYQFHRGSANGVLWDGGYSNPNITGGTTKLMGNAIDGTTTSLPSASFQVVSLVTTGNVQANQICQDRTSHGSWQGDIAEILIYDRALTGAEENQVGYYLGTKYGLTTTYSLTGQPATVTYSGNLASVTFYGVIGNPYNAERSTNSMSTWQVISNYPAGGVMTLNDDVSALTPIPASAFYRLSVP